ncbi:MAG TPA: hypothetical protein VGK19_21295 [Capsulimonadaceae bacterium]|jgi:hypothetical protein
MPVTLESLIKDVKSRLGETNTTRAAQLDSGVDATPVISTDDAITAYLNEAASDLARWSWPIPGSAIANVDAGVVRVAFDTLTDTADRCLHTAVGVSMAGVALRESSQPILRHWQEAQFQAAGTPRYWFVDGDGIGLDKAPTDAFDLTVRGFLLPRPLAEPSDTVDSLPDDLTPLLVFYAAAMVAAKNAEDPSLGPRVAEWMAAFAKGAAAVKARSMARDPETAVSFFAGAR